MSARNRAAAGLRGTCAFATGLLSLALWPAVSTAQTANPGPGLVGLPYANDVERAAAEANQRVFDALDASCNPGAVFDTEPAPAAPPVGTGCTDDRFFVYLNVRELVHTANEIRGSGATVASLGADLAGLGRALRWTAAEELAAQSSMATEFANSQRSNLAARINALRFGAGGFGTAQLYDLDPRRNVLLASTEVIPGETGSGDDVASETYSRWGGFLNGSFGYGSKQTTALEDAFDFDGSELTLGVDYRFPSNLVVGLIFGFGRQAIDFDEAASVISVVDGNMESSARSAIGFAFFQGERLSLSASVGAESLDYDIERDIKYPSFNPDLDSTNSIANSHPRADVGTASFSAAYAVTRKKLILEPFVNVEYLDMSVASFAEERSINLLSDPHTSKRFDLVFGKQRIESLDAAAGLRFQYILTPAFGVLVPYLSLEAHRELADEARKITAGYAALRDIFGSDAFVVRTDPPDRSYSIASLGLSAVLRGGRQRRANRPIAGGLSGFVQLKAVEGLRYYDNSIVAGGFRYEF
jgi:outer membrane autotransporter protein